jgi:hypothetical protein
VIVDAIRGLQSTNARCHVVVIGMYDQARIDADRATLPAWKHGHISGALTRTPVTAKDLIHVGALDSRKARSSVSRHPSSGMSRDYISPAFVASGPVQYRI